MPFERDDVKWDLTSKIAKSSKENLPFNRFEFFAIFEVKLLVTFLDAKPGTFETDDFMN